MASYKEDAPTLVNNLVQEATPGERTDTDKTEEDKTVGDRRDVGNITDKDIGDNTDDSDSDYLY